MRESLVECFSLMLAVLTAFAVLLFFLAGCNGIRMEIERRNTGKQLHSEREALIEHLQKDLPGYFSDSKDILDVEIKINFTEVPGAYKTGKNSEITYLRLQDDIEIILEMKENFYTGKNEKAVYNRMEELMSLLKTGVNDLKDLYAPMYKAEMGFSSGSDKYAKGSVFLNREYIIRVHAGENLIRMEYGKHSLDDVLYINNERYDPNPKVEEPKKEQTAPKTTYQPPVRKKTSTRSRKKSDPYDVYDYDDPDDFADEWADEFGDGDWDDGWDEAYDYWEENR